MWILIQEWLAFIIFVWGVYELFSGVAFWEKLIRSNLPKNIKTIIARFIGLIWIILGGIWMFSFRTELNSQGFLPVLLILSFFVLLLQSILVIIVGEKGMAKQIRDNAMPVMISKIIPEKITS